MCGIVGRVNSAADKPVSANALRTATRLVAHRGPDGEGLFCDGAIGLGHRRLSIVDVRGGAQPMSDAFGRITVVFNGEIYNHDALRAELRSLGHEFRTRSDTEVLVHGYLAWGEALTTHLRGMFAFAVWDAWERRLLLARDRVGIKPLYWTSIGGDLLFASEVKSIFAFRDVPRALEPTHLGVYLALRYVPAPQTLFRGILRLEPGTQLVYQDGRARLTRYWDVPLETSGTAEVRSDDAAGEQFIHVLRESVRLHLMGEVPVGLFLSGGVDSTAVGWAMRSVGAPVTTFSVGFEGAEDELGWARLAAESLRSEHREVRISAGTFGDSLGELVWHLDEPNSDGACVPLMLLARRAREEVVVVLSGEGADEVLGGHGIHRRMLALERVRQRGGGGLARAVGAGLRLVGNARARKYLAMFQTPLERRYFGVGRAFGDEPLIELMGPSAREALVAAFAPLWQQTRGIDPLHRMLYADMRIWLPDDLLHKADRMTMASSVELRVPFLDHVVIEHAWRLPAALKLRDGVGKFLLRHAMQARVPTPILRRPKRGFPVPIGAWLRGPLHGACREQLLASGSMVRTWFGRKAVAALLDRHLSAAADLTGELYALWVLEAWYSTWLSAASVQSGP
ncbi:MAG: asparagine synthase (glutamine-hydrolyzing) [Myxococcaceae bacterium]